jgi:dipeptide/tripeptide permease
MGVLDFGALGFWIFIAAIIVAGIWSKSRREAEKHETLRRMVEKTGTIDEAKLKELFSEPSSEESKPGYGYRAARVGGTILLFTGAGIATFVSIAAGLGKLFAVTEMFHDRGGWIAGFAISAAIAMLGLGIFFSSRFCEPPPGTRSEPPAR